MNFLQHFRLFSGIFSYTEMHYRFRFFPFSLYFRREPEILFDAPIRVGPGIPIPLSLLVKDADRYPVLLEKITLEISYPSGTKASDDIILNKHLSDHWYTFSHSIVPGESGCISISASLHYSIGSKKRIRSTHNIKTSPLYPLRVNVDKEPLPGSNWFAWGDLHYHSNYTEDFVEFGAPLGMSVLAANALGLDFLSVTDHSYDLDDKEGSWTESDPNLLRWKASQKEIDKLSNPDRCLLIPGEEVSAGNQNGENVHFLIYNHPEFIPGSGDGAEIWSKTQSEFSIPDVTKKTDDQCLRVAAHPRVTVSRMEQILLNRGKWEWSDLTSDGLHGLQILNGAYDEFFMQGLTYWVNLLLEGKKPYIYAGNDAHGNFNRYHQIQIPMLTTRIKDFQVLGKCRTGVIKPENFTVDSVITQLKAGKCIITDGPAILLEVHHEDQVVQIGGSVHATSCSISIKGASSELFGDITSVILIHGIINSQTEKIIFEETPGDMSCSYHHKMDIIFSGYIRATIETSLGHKAYTNPIWLFPGQNLLSG